MKVSVNLGSSRPGGVDISFYGLARQTYQDFEIIFTDARYHKRHEQVVDAWASTGCKIPLYHVPNHRDNGTDIWPNTCAGFNTGFMLSDGELVLMMMDHAYAPPTWIENHVKYHDRRRLVTAPHDGRGPLPVKTKDGSTPILFTPDTINEAAWKSQYASFDEVSILAQPFNPEQFESWPVSIDNVPDGPCDPMFIRTKNESFPLDSVLNINGMNEYYDYGQGPGDHDIACRLGSDGLEVWRANDPVLICSSPRSILPNGSNLMTRGDRRAPPPWDYKWCWEEGRIYFQNMRGAKRAPNPYDLREKRKEIWHWRELSQQRATVIPHVVIPDQEYFK